MADVIADRFANTVATDHLVERAPEAAAPVDRREPARIGPNAILQLIAVLREERHERWLRDVFYRSGLSAMLVNPPDEMVDERAGRRSLPSLVRAPAAGCGRSVDRGQSRHATPRAIFWRTAFPSQRRFVLKLLPTRWSAPLLLRAIQRHAWTFAGSGETQHCHEGRRGRRSKSRTNPIAMPGCVWHVGVFETLFQRLVSTKARVRHVACCGDGAHRLLLRDRCYRTVRQDVEDDDGDHGSRRSRNTPAPRCRATPAIRPCRTFKRGSPERLTGVGFKALDPKEPVSLYLHVPFCRKMCWYCGCNMKLANRYEPISDYVGTLIKEIELVADALPGQLPVSHLHWGGGTPTALSPDDLERVMGLIQERFAINGQAELAIESDPRTLTAEMAERIGKIGFTRASFGVQEFDPKVQAAINRIQPPDMVERAVDRLRQAGVTGINFDLIYGLPYQTVESITETIETCRRMQPDRVALFGYAHVPWMAKNQRMIPEEALPDVRARYAQARAAADRLIEAGYQEIGLDHFALPTDDLAIAADNGVLRRNFQGYTTDQAATLLGFGATSIGRTPSGYVQNIAETGAWARAVEGGDLPVAKGHALSDDDRLRGHVIEQIMCQASVDLDELAREFALSSDWCADELRRLEPLAEDGLVTLNAGTIRLTDRGRALARVVAAVFDSYRETANSRHSVAV